MALTFSAVHANANGVNLFILLTHATVLTNKQKLLICFCNYFSRLIFWHKSDNDET